MEIKKPNFKKISDYFLKLPPLKKIAMVILFAVAAFLYIGVIFYLYAWRIEPENQSPINKNLIDQAAFQKAIERINQREAAFESEGGKTYPDPFR